MNIKLILFDLDGVIYDSNFIHYDTLNKALYDITQNNKYVITPKEHISIYDGLKTSKKLKLLTQNKGLSTDSYSIVYFLKQKYTLLEYDKITPNESIINVFKTLKDSGYNLGCCTNSNKKIALTLLGKLDLLQYLDLIVTNDDVINGKPHPEVYWKAMSIMNTLPHETLIIEDSPRGLASANNSGANVMRVKNSNDVNLDRIYDRLKNSNKKIMNKWNDSKLNIVIPMAGAGSRFETAGYEFPKPLINVRGNPMIQVVVGGLNIDANYIYIVQKSHREKYNLDTLLNLITPNCKIVEVDGITEGAACTVLLAKEHINNDNPLILTNSDQFIIWDSTDFMYQMNENNFDGSIVCFEATHPKWSFAKTNEDGIITEVAEKNPISNQATAGIYYFKHGSDYVKYAEQMIEKNIRVNNEFYVCPVYNEVMADNKIIFNYQIPSENMWGLGTPEDLNYYLENYK